MGYGHGGRGEGQAHPLEPIRGNSQEKQARQVEADSELICSGGG